MGRPVQRLLLLFLSLLATAAVAIVPAGASAATGDISTAAGNGVNADSGDGGLATSASMRSPLGVAVAPNGDRYIADYGSHKVRKVTPAGIISTFAGTGSSGLSGDGGAATSATLRQPADVAVDAAGNVYIADAGNSRVRKVTPGGTISTYAGSFSGYSGDGGQAVLARLTSPFGIDIDSSGNLYIADFNHTVRRVTAAGVISTVAGTGTAGSTGDGGPATIARLNGPADVVADDAGNLYIAEYSGQRVRKVNTSGIISRFAGTGTAGTTGNGGLATSAEIDGPWGIEADTNGNVYISEIAGHVVRKVSSLGMISTMAGTGTAGFLGDGGPATSARLNGPAAIDIGPSGDAFLADYTNRRVRMIEGIGIPGAPTLTGTSPVSPANANSVQVIGSAASGSTVTLYSNSSCTTSVATGTAAAFSSTGIPVTVADNSTTTFYATASNAAGTSTCSPTSVTYVEDSVPPGAPVMGTPPGSPGSGRSPSWTFTGDAGATIECRLDRGATTISNWATCTSPRSYDLTGQSDGTYTLSLRARDAAGNTSTVTTSSYVLDTTAPVAPTIGFTPTSPGSSRTPSWGFTGEAGATFECQLSRGATTLSAWGTCTTPRLYDLNGEADGTYTFAVRARDAAGNPGTAATSNYVLDTTAPSTPAITSAPPTAGSAESPSWSFTGDAGAGFQCKLERGATVVSDWSTCSGSRSYPLAGEPDAAYTFSVRSRDTAGNTSLAATSGYTLDRVAPGTPSILTRPTTPDNDPTPSWTFSGDAGATVECRLDRAATPIAGWGTCASPSDYDLLGEVDGTYTLSLRARDAAGNLSTVVTDDFVLDRNAPSAPSINTTPGALGSETSPAWAFTSEAGATFECRLEHSGGGGAISDWSSCTSPRSYDISGESDGAFTFRVRATDTAGNTGVEATHAYTLDRSLPSSPNILTSPPSPSTGRMPQWSFSGAGGETFDCRLERDGATVSDWADCTTPHAYNLTGEADGTYKFLVRAEDALNRLGAPATSLYVLDTTDPAAPTIGNPPTSPGNDATPAWSFTSEPGVDFSCRVMRGATEAVPSTACDSGDSFDLSGKPDGAYTLEVVATDAAGNSSDPAVSAAYALDRAAPAPPNVDSSPVSPGSGRSPGWTFSGEASATFECRLDRGATAIAGWGSCSASRTYDLTDLADATYTFSVRARDTAGNLGTAATSPYDLDTTAPAAPSFLTEPATPDNSRNIQWTFSGEASASFECRLERGGTAVEDWTSCSGSADYDLTGLPDGTYTLLVQATDDANNAGAVATSAYVLDTTPPADPVLDAEPASPSSDPDVAWAFSGDGDTAALECRLRRGATVVSGWGACSSPHSFDLSAEVDGDYTFEIVARDGVGNASGTTTDVYRFDRSGPSAPSIDSAPATPSADATPSWSFSGEAGADFECRLSRSGTIVSNWAACSSGSRAYDLTGESDGLYLFSTRARDAAGNTGPAATSSFALDRAAPAQPTINGAPGVTGTGRNPTWSFSAEATSTLECRLERGATVVSDWGTCSTPKSYDLTGAPDGAYTFKVRARNPLGTASAAQSDVYTLDTAAPAAPAISTNPGAVGSSRSPAWSFTGEGGATLECRLERSGSAVYDWATCTSPLTYDLSGRSDGSYAFKVRARDAAGNTGSPANHTYELDTTGPAAPALTAAPASPGSSRAPAWSWSGDGGATFVCRIDRGSDAVADWAPCVSGQPRDLAGQPDGNYTLSVRAVDAAGNSGGVLTSAYELDTTPGALSIGSGPAPVVRDRHPAWAFAAEAGAAVTCRLVFGSDVVADWAACGSPHSFDLTGRPDGDYAFFVRAADRAGNTGSDATWPFRLDTVAPPKPVVDARPPQRDNDRTPEWSLSGETGAALECRVDHGSDVLYDWRPCTAPLKVDLRAQEDGVYVLSARALDSAGNVGDTVATSYRLDTADPEAPEITTRPGRTGDDRKPKWGWRGESAATFECRLRRGGDVVKDWRSCETPHAYDLTDERVGAYTFSVHAIDAAGNTGTAASDDYELRASSSGGSNTGSNSGGGGDSGGGGGGGGAAPASDPAPAAGPATPGAPAAAPPSLKPNADDPDDADDGGGDEDAGTGDSKGGGAGAGAGGPGGKGGPGAARGGPGAAANGPGGGGSDGSGRGDDDGKPKKKFSEDPLGAAGESVAKVAAVIAEEPEKTAFPMGLIFVIGGFMGLQGRIDRNDPKLALAPVFADPDLEFRPPRDAREVMEDL